MFFEDDEDDVEHILSLEESFESFIVEAEPGNSDISDMVETLLMPPLLQMDEEWTLEMEKRKTKQGCGTPLLTVLTC